MQNVELQPELQLQTAEENLKKIRFVINVSSTRYDIVKKVARQVCNWRLKHFEEDCDGAIVKGERNQKLSPLYDITWHDTAITAEFFSKLLPYQKVNIYPGIQCLSRKDKLAKNLMKMYKAFPQEYDFFPKTWLLPQQLTELRNHSAHYAGGVNSKRRKPWYICKPDA